jgi:tetratricopeptide (TPR) repeat protein
MGYLWWQLPTGGGSMIGQVADALPSFQPVKPGVVDLSPIDKRDEALLRLRQGDLLAARGQWSLAAEEYQKAVDAKGGLPALRKLATAQLQKRDVRSARITAEQMRKEGARAEDMLLLESIILLRTGEIAQAQTMLSQAPESPQKAYGLGLLAILQENHDEAKKQLNLVIGGWEPVLRSYARALMGAYDEYALFPQSPALHLTALLGRSLAQVQECELALPLLTRVTQQQADYRDAWIVEGYCELSTERYQESLASLEKAYQIDPEKPETQYFLARAYAGLEDHNNAVTFLQYALQNGFTPELEVRRALASEAVEAGNMPLAIEQLEAMTGDPQATIEVFTQFVTVSLGTNQNEGAYLKALEATRKWPNDPEAHVLLGKSALATEWNEEAKAALEKALRLDPGNAEAEELMKKL